MKIAITGGTGLVGKQLVQQLQLAGAEIFVLTRNQSHFSNGVHYIQWLSDKSFPEKHLEGINAIINLAGTSLNNGRWSKTLKEEIYSSRIAATKEVLRIIKALKTPPEVLINASAIGIYPSSNKSKYTETSTETAHDFLANTVRDWEDTAKRAEDLGVRVVLTRFGVILGKNGGALPMMVMPYKLYIGGTVGTGTQWVSWIHLEDVVEAIIFSINQENINGIVNFTSPNPVTMKEFGKTIGEVLHRPHWFPVPSILMKLALGEKSQLVLEGQNVHPSSLLKANYQFKYPTLKYALENLL